MKKDRAVVGLITEFFFLLLWLFVLVLGFELKAYKLSRQVFYHPSHPTSPFL
jgi:hypothetical protein